MHYGGSGGCMKFPACVLAQKKRRKRHALKVEQYHRYHYLNLYKCINY
uniref:Zf-C4_Topoisom domain-containing protein n=1 Tax=Heterorhabditis bacteriophora TaxID=37862 RepID=A0A1I7WAG8_HETBA